jgi:CheY-like chemotaxis protein
VGVCPGTNAPGWLPVALPAVLGLLGCDTRAGHDGASALDVAAPLRPGACLLDLSMPGMDRFEAARRLRVLAARALPAAGVLDRVIRQEGHLGRQLDLTLRQLERLQAARKPASPVVAAVLTGLGAGMTHNLADGAGAAALTAASDRARAWPDGGWWVCCRGEPQPPRAAA